jgi:hypothetical protein
MGHHLIDDQLENQDIPWDYLEPISYSEEYINLNYIMVPRELIEQLSNDSELGLQVRKMYHNK